MTEMTPLAKKLRNVYHNSAAWNAVAEAAEAELAAQRTVRLPTVAECRQARNDVLIDNWDWHASAVLDLVASLNPTWVEVPADATIPNDTLVRQELVGREDAQEWVTRRDLTPASRLSLSTTYYVPSGTVLIQPVDPRVEAAAKAIHAADQQDGDEQRWDTDTDAIRDTYVRLAKAAIDALGEDI